MTELMGTLRPVKQRRNATSYADVDAVGNVNASVRYRENDDSGITEVLDDVEMPFVPDAEGIGLFDQAGELLTWLPAIAASPDTDLVLRPGWGFQTSWAASDIKAREHAGATTRG